MRLGIDPKVDYVFKKLFGSEANKSLLIDLLNAILRVSLEAPIVDGDILNPFNDKETLDDKLSILDIRARDSDGRWYNIEMQMAAFAWLPARILYYWSRMYQQQLSEGDHYRELRPTVSICIVDGTLTDALEFHQEYVLSSRRDPHLIFCPHLSIHVIELPKFMAQMGGLRDALDRWCWFLRYGEELEATAIPENLRTPPIERAVEILKMITQAELERERYESRQKALRDHAAKLSDALETGHAKGLAEGRAEAQLEEIRRALEMMFDVKFGEVDKSLLERILSINDYGRLRAIQDKLHVAKSIKELEAFVAAM